MKSVVIRAGSITVQPPHPVPGSPRVSLSRNDSLSRVFSGERSTAGSPRISLHFDVNSRKDKAIRRALSESDILRSAGAEVPAKSPALKAEELGFRGGDRVMSTVTVDRDEQRKMGAYYQEILKSNPSDPLLLRNYGKFLHEVEKDTVRAEEYYCRAILASPGDGELLSLYGKLIWETQRDQERAKSYFDQAVSASPDGCMVLGSIANFMWEAEEDEDGNEEEEINNNNTQIPLAPTLVPAF